MDWLFMFYLAFIFAYRLAQFYAIIVAKNLYRPDHSGDYLLTLVWGPLFLAMIGGPYEYFLQRELPSPILIALGTIFFGGAIILRGISLADLTKEFFIFEDKNAKHQLVTKGIYRHIRHPLYLANIMLMIGASFYFGSYFAFFAGMLGVAGVIVKINLEEELLHNQFSNFPEYKASTSKLIPKIY